MRREELISLISSQISVSHEQAGNFLEKLRIYPREAWDAGLPAGCELSDVYPWKFKRRFSLLRRPFIQIDKAENPKFLVSPLLVRQAIRYLTETSYEGEFSQEFFQTESMRRFCDHAVKRRSSSFVQRVSKKLESFGYQTRIDTKMSIFGASSTFGDVDILAWKTDPTTQVLVLECKALRNARSTSEILSQLNEFEGDADDKLARHLARVQWLTDNINVLQRFLKIDLTGFQAWVITSHTVPMQFIPKDMKKKSHFIDYSYLAEHFS
ncbi:MAG: hypothetical protein HC904_08415 [Blastochloris sp.]|nr:hypothetical protein [Blastochloris sp.]